MAYVRVNVDGKTVMDQDVGSWQRKPPSMIKDFIKAGVRPELWQQAVLIIVSDAVLREQSMNVDVHTGSDKWTLSVETVPVP
jgi:hypothetical protein